jgi:hypothetical protein
MISSAGHNLLCERIPPSIRASLTLLSFLLLIWDNASWHVSRELRRWLGRHNRCVKESGEGVRIVSCLLPKQSPWLNAIEPKWVPGKRKVVEAEELLGPYGLAERVRWVTGCLHYEHLSIPQEVA